MQININAYDPNKFKKNFVETEIYQKLIFDYDCVGFEKNWQQFRFITPRQHWAQAHPSYFSAVPFYYLDFLVKKNPKKIYDIGCGWNIFKKYIPNIIGIGAENPGDENFYADIHSFVDDEFIMRHQNYFESAFSICALHFVPLSNLKKVVLDFYSILAPGGTGWVALNLQRMLEHDLSIPKINSKSITDLDINIRNQIYDIGIDFLVVDIDLTELNEFMNGNIRLVMQKK